ncbi:MAG TPA: dihydrofolate reductase family protein [Candidatus Saccharimonadia bacterium]|nr:dihydrofolate reductase family protein [Candidatus Saccharimonadia bacterium]
MGRLVVSEFITLDGVFEDPGGTEGKAYGGWQTSLTGEEEIAFKLDELKQADALLVGRVTYEGFASARLGAGDKDKIGILMDTMPKYVATLTVSEFNWQNSQALAPNVYAAVSQLKQQYARDILVVGSGQLVASLLENDLVDELRLMTYPILLGQGRRLFDGAPHKKLQYVSTQAFGGGAVLLTYSQRANH